MPCGNESVPVILYGITRRVRDPLRAATCMRSYLRDAVLVPRIAARMSLGAPSGVPEPALLPALESWTPVHDPPPAMESELDPRSRAFTRGSPRTPHCTPGPARRSGRAFPPYVSQVRKWCLKKSDENIMPVPLRLRVSTVCHPARHLHC